MRLATFLLAICAFAQVEAPSIGTLLDASGRFRPVYGVAGNFTLGPPVTARATDLPASANTLERRGNAIQILRPDGAVLDSLPATEGPVLLTSHGTIFTTAPEVILRRPDASEARFPLNNVVALRAMSADWVQVNTSSAIFALRLDAGREALFALPATPRSEVRRR